MFTDRMLNRFNFSTTCHGWLLCALVILLVSTPAVAAIQFQDSTSGSGITYEGESFGASWGNLDNDAYPDLFVSNHRSMVGLYRNNGNGTFTNRSSQVTTWASKPDRDTHGGAWGDFDNDGDHDLMVGTGRGNDNQFFVNNNGQLEDRTALYNIKYSEWAGRLATWFDYNNDGLLDFVMGQYNGNSAVLKQGSGTFINTTSASGFTCTTTPYGQLLDINRDGDLDFLCAADGTFPFKIYDASTTPFQNITALLPAVPNSVDTEIADFDGDLIPDIFYVRGTVRSSDAATNGNNKLEAVLVNATKTMIFSTNGAITIDMDWRQLRDSGNFKNIRIGASGFSPTSVPFTLNPSDPAVAGLQGNITTTAPYLYIGYNTTTKEWTFRLNSNGTFSNVYLLISSTSTITGLRTAGFFASEAPLPPVLYAGQNQGYVNRTITAGLNTPISCISAAAADYDNDMDVDLYLACRAGAQNLANRLYENRGNGVFDLVPGAGGATGPVGLAILDGVGTADSVVTADYNVDGFMDLFVTNGLNMEPMGVGGSSRLYRNVGNGNNWIQLDLQGTTSNRDGVGARIYAIVPGKTQLHLQNGRYHRWSQHQSRAHFGLAGNTLVDLRVEWPSGKVNLHNNVAANKIYKIVEGGGITVIGGTTPPTPTLSIDNVTVSESAGNATFTVTLSPSSTNTVSVDYMTENGTALAGSDYTGVSGGLTFSPGQTSKTVSVPILHDTQVEPTEAFSLNLSNAVNAAVGTASGTGTITDDDATGISPCGQPTYNVNTDRAIFIWRDCTTGVWSTRFLAGGGYIRYRGVINSDQAFTSVKLVNIESTDVVDYLSNTSRISYDVAMKSPNFDGFDFSHPATANLCFALNYPAGTPVYLGAGRALLTAPFNLKDFGPC